MSTITSGGRASAREEELRMQWERDQQRGDVLDADVQEPGTLVARRSAMPAHAVRPKGVASRGFLTPALALWLVVYTLLNVGDLLTTYLGLQLGLREANPLMSGLLMQSGFGALIAYKLVVIVAVIGGAFALFRMHPRAAHVTVYVCNFLVFLAVAANVLQMVAR